MPRRTRQKLSPRTIAITVKAVHALELRAKGTSFAAIASQCGYNSEAAAYLAVKAALLRTQREPAEEVRQLELVRLDRWLLALQSQIENGALDALDRGLKIMARRAALLGLDAPAKMAPTTPDGAQPYEPASQGMTDDLVAGVAAVLAQYGQLRRNEAGDDAGVAAEPLYPSTADGEAGSVSIAPST